MYSITQFVWFNNIAKEMFGVRLTVRDRNRAFFYIC